MAATLSCVRTSFARSLNLMRCAVFGSYHVRRCHHKTEGSEPGSETKSHDEQTVDNEDESSDYYTASDSDEDEGIDDDSISERILTTALEFVPEHGWSAEAIAEGAKIEGYSGMAEGMFPREGGDLVLHFINKCNLELGNYLADNSRTEEENRKKIRQSDFIKDAIKVRLKMITPYVDSWPQAMGLMLYPSSASDALESVANMTDDIWYHSNDSSTDINWYLKRASLATVYGLTELYMVQDKSVDFQDTWTFLDRRFQDIQTTGNIKYSCGKVGEDMSRLVFSTLSLVRNITGFNKWDR